MGLKILYDTLSSSHEVTIVAPLYEMNASSHSLTLRKKLKIKKFSPTIYGVKGTPTDCVLVGVYKLLPVFPELVLSGVNLGANLGDDVTYSGTVGAAFEATLIGIKSAAISFFEKDKPDFQEIKKFVPKLIEKMKSLEEGVFLNINIPYNPKGVKITKLGRREYIDIIEERGKAYIIGGKRKDVVVPNTDYYACKNGYISITPLRTDLTHYEFLNNIVNWKF
jgi:5'-nucleotidase